MKEKHCNKCNEDWPWVYICEGCGSYVGMHPFTDIPLGTLADAATREARKECKAPIQRCARKLPVLSQKWEVHTATGCSIRSESGIIVFEYPLSVHRERINIEEYKRWLDYADHICELHNQSIEGS